MAQRNLALAYARRQQDYARSVPTMEAALRLERNPRFLLEMDQLYERAGAPLAKRLAAFEENQAVSGQRDDTLAREIAVRVQAGQYDRALELLRSHTFHVWEGASITTHGTYVNAHLLRGHERMKAGRYAEALEDYRAALAYPENLGEGKSGSGDRSAVIDFYIAAVHTALGQHSQASEMLKRCAAEGGSDRDPEGLYHYALALRKLGETERSSRALNSLMESGRKLLDGGAVDHFAKFGNSRPLGTSQAQAHFSLGLAYLGTGDSARAKLEFQQAIKLDSAHLWARHYLSLCL